MSNPGHGRIYAFSGTHGTGKTTATFTKAADLKRAHPDKTVGIISETAALCPYGINKNTSRQSQEWIFHTQIKTELDMLVHYDLLVSDRSCVDAIAYTAVAGYDDLALTMLRMAHIHIHYYKEIRFCLAASRPYHHADGFREHEDKPFRAQVEEELLSLYRRLDLHKNGTLIYV